MSPQTRKIGEPWPIFQVWAYSRMTLDTEERANEIVRYLMSRLQFRPNRFGEYEPFKHLDEENIADAVALVMNRAGQALDSERVHSAVFFQRTAAPRCSYLVSWSKLPHRAFEISIYSLEARWTQGPKCLAEWLDVVFGLFRIQDIWYARFGLDEEGLAKNYLTWRSQHPAAIDPAKGVEVASGVGVRLEEGIPGVYWGNYLGPFYVSWFGRDKLDLLPAVEKRWLDTGGLFFTTAASPLEWDSVDARQLQMAIRDYLGADTFFDMETVRSVIAELEPIPETMSPEMFQPPRRVPKFPFQVISPVPKPIEEEMAESKQAFENMGLELVRVEGLTLVFHGKGGITKVTVGPNGRVEYWPGASL